MSYIDRFITVFVWVMLIAAVAAAATAFVISTPGDPAVTYEQTEPPGLWFSSSQTSYTQNITPNQTVEVRYTATNHDNVTRTVNRTVWIYGPWNNTTEIIEDEYGDSAAINASIPPDASVDGSVYLSAPPEPGVYVLDMGTQSSAGCVLDDGRRKIVVVNGTGG